MTPEKKQIVNKVLANLDDTATRIGALVKEGKMDARLASSIVRDIDAFADKFEIAAFGQESFNARRAKMRQAKVIEHDPDEKYMETFQNTVKPLETDPDEGYMHKMDASFNGKAQDTYDMDRSSTVSERDEYQVRDLNEYPPGTKKQPSWPRGPAGKSTKQGATAPRTASIKTWAP